MQALHPYRRNKNWYFNTFKVFTLNLKHLNLINSKCQFYVYSLMMNVIFSNTLFPVVSHVFSPKEN